MLIGSRYIYGMKVPQKIWVPFTAISIPTFLPDYRFPAFKEIERGDVVVFEYPRDGVYKYVKRCIGLPGDKIKIENRKVFVNDNGRVIETGNVLFANLKLSDVGGGSFDAIKNSLKIHEIRNIATYVWIWTALMTIQWITAINIVEEWSQNPEQRLRFFAIVEQVTSPLTLVVQLFLTNIIIKKFGIRNIMFLYGILFFFAYLAYGLAPSIISVGVVTVLLRIFEYGVNKPTRETIFTTFKKNDRYKSTVFIDTFITRFGDLSGSGFIALGKLTSVAANSFPLIAIPIAGYLSFLGIKISKKVEIKDL